MRSGTKPEKIWSGWARAKILHFASGRIELGPKFHFLFRAKPGPGQNFYVYFGPDRARPRLQPLWAGPGPEKSSPCRPLAGVTFYNGLSSLLMCEGLSNFGGGADLRTPLLGTALVAPIVLKIEQRGGYRKYSKIKFYINISKIKQ